MNRQSISALLPTFNSERYIRDCLESIKWVDEIVVVDSFSTDATLDICREYTDRIYQHEYINSARQKNWALQHVNTEWVLQIDCDERAELELRGEIREILSKSHGIDGFRLRIKNLVWGKWVRSCDQYPCAQVRLFRARKGRWSDREVHAVVIGLDIVENLKHHYIHFDLDDLSQELQQFASQVVVWESNELIKKGKKWRWWDVTLRPAAVFLLYYLGKGGYREGFRGLYLSVYQAFYTFMKYSRLYEYRVQQADEVVRLVKQQCLVENTHVIAK